VVTIPWLLSLKKTSDSSAEFKTLPSFPPDGILAGDNQLPMPDDIVRVAVGNCVNFI
jgi:hypothetical protein